MAASPKSPSLQETIPRGPRRSSWVDATTASQRPAPRPRRPVLPEAFPRPTNGSGVYSLMSLHENLSKFEVLGPFLPRLRGLRAVCCRAGARPGLGAVPSMGRALPASPARAPGPCWSSVWVLTIDGDGQEHNTTLD